MTIVLVSDFDFVLPPELIAQEPLPDRAASRLLHLSANSGIEHRAFRDFPKLLRPDDLVVFNNTKVFPARLYGVRSEGGAGRIEVLLTRQLSSDPNEWECLVRPGKKIGIGDRICFGENQELQAEVVDRGSFGERRICFHPCAHFFAHIESLGRVPLPPYIDRKDGDKDRPADRERYQTVYARERGSVAAPTAGLHFTPEILEQIKSRGIEIAEITLHVGLGTFQPARAENVEDHQIHSEAYSIPSAVADAVNAALASQRRIVAIGTTTVRALEHAARASGNGGMRSGPGEANLFMYPGFEFRVVGALLTNFHLPRSTLLMLVSAFGGKKRLLDAYAEAIDKEYRFYSFGDCMFIEPAERRA